jgi:hypothetical protein
MNLNELKARLEGLNRRTQSSSDVWKPKDEHDVRLVKDPKAEPLPSLAFHYNVGDAREILCPKVNFGEECAICDFADMMRSWKDENGRDKPDKIRQQDFEVFKKIQAVEKVYTPVVERLEGGGISPPKWWGLTKNQALQILEVCTDADRLRECGIEPQDTDRATDAVYSNTKAFDLHVSFKKPGEKGNTKTFTAVDIKPKYRPSALTGNAKKDAEIVSQVKPLKEVFPRVPSNEVEVALKKFINASAPEAKADGGEEKYAEKKPTNSNEKAAKVGGRSIEEAFGDLADEK